MNYTAVRKKQVEHWIQVLVQTDSGRLGSVVRFIQKLNSQLKTILDFGIKNYSAKVLYFLATVGSSTCLT